MIITEITGGLGNQLFQYAAGLSLAVRHQTELKINIQFKEGDTVRSLGLSHFNAILNQASKEEINDLYPSSVFERITQRLLPTQLKKYYLEKEFSYQHSFEQLGPNVYLKGYWQSELYFSSIKEKIRSVFTLAAAHYTKATLLIEELNQINSVAIHIRKGDYLIHPYSSYYANVDLNYYNQAIALLNSKFTALKLFVFSDDVTWVKSNLRLNLPYTLVSTIHTNSMYEDFKAMQSCKYHIISNSSFSWWTAWLCERTDKVVIAPQKWFNHGPKDTQDLIPKTWLTV